MTRLPSPFPTLPKIGATVARRAAPRVEVTPEEEESLARKAGRIGLGGIAAVGNLLDLPGSSVRDVLAGENPLDQWLHPFSGESRTTGRQLLRKAGMIGTQDNWKNWVGGLAGEIALDPLTYVFPFGALTKGGRVAKAAGLSTKTAAIAAQKIGKPVASLGRREAQLATTLDDLIKAGGPGAREAAETAAKGKGWRLDELLNEPQRGMFATGFLGKVGKVYGTGARGMKVARALDKIGMKVGQVRIPGTQIQPLNALYRTFSAPIVDTRTHTGQVFRRQMFELQTKGHSQARKEMAGYIDDLVKEGHATDEEAQAFRAWLEGVHQDPKFMNSNIAVKDVPPELQGLVQKIVRDEDAYFAALRARGVDPEQWVSPVARHITRFMTEMPGKRTAGTGGWSSFGAGMPEAASRLNFLQPYTDKAGVQHAIHGETWTIQKIVEDPKLWEMQDQGLSRGQRAAYIRSTYGDLVPAKFVAEGKKGPQLQNRYLALAKWVEKMDPEVRATGMFGNHPLVDMQAARIHARDAMAAAESVRDLLLSPEVLRPATSSAAETVELGVILRALKIKSGDINEGFAKWLAEGMGVDINAIAKADPSVAANRLDELMKMRVNRDIAADLRNFRKPFTSPQPVHEVLQAFDAVTNLFKGGVTSPWPAFHVRNFFSGQYQNYVAGMFSLRAIRDTRTLLKGGVIEGAKEFPAVKALAAQRGIANLTDETATNLVGQLIYAQGLSHRYSGEAMTVSGVTNAFGPSSLAATRAEIPGYGVSHIQPGRIGRKYIGREPGTSFNPLRMRGGFQGDIESKFGPVAAGEEVAQVVESFNRISPFIHQLRKGVDPTAAATKIGAAQVLYQSRYYTNAETKLFKRLFPFYSFSSRMIPWTFRELAERPSGKLAQTIRLANRMRNPNAQTPDYVAETLSIPAGQTPEGGQKYVTGAGLMAEDPISFLGGGVRGALLEAGSRLNPMLKAPLEWATGQTFFQKGPQGGRALEDLDPTIGRTLANLTGQREAVKLPQGLEFAVANSPLSRLTTTARTMTYPLRAARDPNMAGQLLPEAIRSAVNLGTGFRVTNVSPAAQDALLRERAQRMMKAQGGKTFIKTYIPEEVEADMTPKELADAKQLEALMNTLTNRSKARSEKWKKAEAARR